MWHEANHRGVQPLVRYRAISGQQMLRSVRAYMRRRDFITLMAARRRGRLRCARERKSVIGILGSQSPAAAASNMAAFPRGLSESGYVEGKNVAIEYRWGEGQNNRLPALAADLVQRQAVRPLMRARNRQTGVAAVSATARRRKAFSKATGLCTPVWRRRDPATLRGCGL